MAKKRPAFQFYASDWLGSTKRAMMTPAQRGAYIDLLCHQWNDPDCSLPDDDATLAVLSGLDEGWLNGGCTLLRKCFPVASGKPGRLANPRLIEVRADADEWSRKSREGGIKSGEVRRAKADEAKTYGGQEAPGVDVKGGSTKGGTKDEPNTNPSPSSSSSPSSLSSPPPPPPPEGESSCRSYRFDEEDSATAAWMLGLIRDLKPNFQEPNLDEWSNTIRLMRERDKKPNADIRDLFTHANNDDFWQNNILSPGKLRKQWDQLDLKLRGTGRMDGFTAKERRGAVATQQWLDDKARAGEDGES